MRVWTIVTAVAICVTALLALGADRETPTTPHFPVLVELFTSEGCSSCPPADALLERLDDSNNPAKPEVIVLSEHVDYWNDIGWKDPYSASAFSQRQGIYARRFHLNDVYTPEMVVDGETEFVGSDSRAAHARIAAAGANQRIPVGLIATASSIRVEIPPASSGTADVLFAIASNEASTQVIGGENGGLKLHHVALARSITPVGQIRAGQSFSKAIALEPDMRGKRAIAWVQQTGQGRVLGSAMHVW